MTSKPARLKIILGENNVEKLTLPDRVPLSLVELVNIVQNTFGQTDIRLQYMDEDFGYQFFNLNTTTEVKDLGTIKVVPLEIVPLTFTVTAESSPVTVLQESACSSVASTEAVLSSLKP
ncbi:unnamed protein product [Knipowitschia caucasica]